MSVPAVVQSGVLIPTTAGFHACPPVTLDRSPTPGNTLIGVWWASAPEPDLSPEWSILMAAPAGGTFGPVILKRTAQPGDTAVMPPFWTTVDNYALKGMGVWEITGAAPAAMTQPFNSLSSFNGSAAPGPVPVISARAGNTLALIGAFDSTNGGAIEPDGFVPDIATDQNQYIPASGPADGAAAYMGNLPLAAIGTGFSGAFTFTPVSTFQMAFVLLITQGQLRRMSVSNFFSVALPCVPCCRGKTLIVI